MGPPQVGDEVPILERALDAAALMAYGAATWDWHRLHYDAAYARERGAAAAVADGQMIGALCARAVTSWLGPGAFVCKLAYRMRSMVLAGDTVRVTGAVTGSAPDDGGVRVTVVQRVHVGDRLAAEATTTVRLPAGESD